MDDSSTEMTNYSYNVVKIHKIIEDSIVNMILECYDPQVIKNDIFFGYE